MTVYNSYLGCDLIFGAGARKMMDGVGCDENSLWPAFPPHYTSDHHRVVSTHTMVPCSADTWHNNHDLVCLPGLSWASSLGVMREVERKDAKDLKDYMRQAGEVTYADAHKDRRNEGVVEFASHSDMKNALEKLDDTELNGRRIRLIEDRRRSRRSRSSSSRSRSRSRSRRRSRSRSRSRRSSRSRSRRSSRSRSKGAKSPSRSKSRSKSNDRKSKSRSRSKSQGMGQKSRSRSVDKRDDSMDRSGSKEKSKSRSRSVEKNGDHSANEDNNED